MLGLIASTLVPIVQQSTLQSIGWELQIEYECGVVISDVGVIEVDTHKYSKPVSFLLLSNEAEVTLDSYRIDSHGIKDDQVFLSETSRYSDSETISNWVGKTIELEGKHYQLDVYAWIPAQYQMAAGNNEVSAIWSINCS